MELRVWAIETLSGVSVAEIRVYLRMQSRVLQSKPDPRYNPLNWLSQMAFYGDGPWSRPGSRSSTIF